MAVNTRFCTGIHTLLVLAAEPELQQTSEEIAGKLKTNPVVIRRVLSLLRQAGIVSSQKGPSGGSKLAKPGKAISLGEVYRALEPVSIFHGSNLGGEHAAKVNLALEKIYRDAQTAMETELDSTTLSQLAKKSEKKKK
jgi:Rrf2 family protein